MKRSKHGSIAAAARPAKRDWGVMRVIASWRAEQNALRGRMIVEPLKVVPRFVAGADAAVVLACVTRYRIPEPTRRADIEVAAVRAVPISQ